MNACTCSFQLLLLLNSNEEISCTCINHGHAIIMMDSFGGLLRKSVVTVVLNHLRSFLFITLIEVGLCAYMYYYVCVSNSQLGYIHAIIVYVQIEVKQVFVQ